jgi:hypothetical protein
MNMRSSEIKANAADLLQGFVAGAPKVILAA